MKDQWHKVKVKRVEVNGQQTLLADSTRPDFFKWLATWFHPFGYVITGWNPFYEDTNGREFVGWLTHDPEGRYHG